VISASVIVMEERLFAIWVLRLVPHPPTLAFWAQFTPQEWGW